jgi:TAG lipase/steryl ester hydrolase/phospholipase A2/LPA acyltransferase
LYGVTHVGTKQLIEDYIEEVCKQLTYIATSKTDTMGLTTKIEYFANIQKAFGRTALLLSGGASFGTIGHIIIGLCHLGVLKTLFESKLLPRIISGSSVGSILASMVCVKSDEELTFLFQPDKLEMVNMKL